MRRHEVSIKRRGYIDRLALNVQEWLADSDMMFEN
jgi:hypothetical protein